jgi:hypothetical protein
MRDEDDSTRAVQISTRLEPELVRAIEQRARLERRSISNCIASLIAAAVSGDQGAAA